MSRVSLSLEATYQLDLPIKSFRNYRITETINSEDVKSYRPISLLPMLSKVLELLFLNRLSSIIKEIPDYQLGFWKGHGTIEQVHRVVNLINKARDENKFCRAIFLGISQAFDKVW